MDKASKEWIDFWHSSNNSKAPTDNITDRAFDS